MAEVDMVNRPPHYTSVAPEYETIKIIEALNLDYCLGNAFKYISRAGKKDPAKEIEDLEKSVWYIRRKIMQLQIAQQIKSTTSMHTQSISELVRRQSLPS